MKVRVWLEGVQESKRSTEAKRFLRVMGKGLGLEGLLKDRKIC